MKTIRNTIEDRIRYWSVLTCIVIGLLLLLFAYKTELDKRLNPHTPVEETHQLQEMTDYHQSQGITIIIH